MSHIHNLTSHLKNTTITPAPTPQLTYQLAQNGLKIYQANKMQNHHNHHPTPRMLRPAPNANRPNSLHSPGRKGANYPHRIISNAITLTPTPTPNHFSNSILFQQHSQLQQQLRKPTILTHPQQRGPTPASIQQFVNHTPAHRGQLKPRYPPPPVNSHQNHVANHHPTMYDSAQPFLQNNGPYNSPTKVTNSPAVSYTASLPSGLNNGTPTPTSQQIAKQSNANPLKRSSTSGTVTKSSNSNPSCNPSGGAARLQNVLNNRKSLSSNKSNPIPAGELGNNITIKQESCTVSLGSKKEVGLKVSHRLPPTTTIVPAMPVPVIVKTEDVKPNITTEHVTRGPRPYQKGDDVLLTTDDGTFLFGTVGMVHGDTLQIMFGDGTQQLASFNKVKLLSCSVNEEDGDSSASADLKNHFDVDSSNLSSKNSSTKLSKSTGNSANHTQQPPNNAVLPNEEVTCGSCGVVKRVAGKKALSYAPHTKTQFNCRRCMNKSRFGNKGIPPIPSPPNSKGKTTATSSSPNSTTKSSTHRRTSDDNSRAICFHCENRTNNNDRLHCNLCERACHLSCLAMTPTPLEGDRFWDVICSACGTQNGDSNSTTRSKVFSCRRSITSWSDVAHLILSCLASDPENSTGERFFDLEKDIIPFIMTHTDRLHLPRTYKNIQPDCRKDFLSTALHNATLRFLNGAEVHRKGSLWAIRENNNHQGYPLRVIAAAKTPQKNKVKVPHQSPPTTPNGITARLMRTPNNKWTSGSGPTPSSPAGLSSVGKGSNKPREPESRTPPKRKLKEEDPPELDKYDAPFITGSSTPGKAGRVMSQTERLVQKAKKTCLKTKEGVTDGNHKRKASDVASCGGSPESKRIKLSPKNGLIGITRSPTANKVPSPIPNKQVAQWLDRLNSDGSRKFIASPGSNVGSPVLSETSSMLFGKAVKSAGITPPGNYANSPEKPSLRLRKPKSFNLAKGDGKDKVKINGMVPTPPKLFAKLKGRLGKQKSNAATARFSQIPASNGAIPSEDLTDAIQSEFSLLSCNVEDLIEHGQGYRIHCLPEVPITTDRELQSVQKKVASAYASELPSCPPAYLNCAPSLGAIPNRKGKSKKNVKNLHTYEIVGRRIDANGNVFYQAEWKDGYGNDSDGGEDELLLDWEDLDDLDASTEPEDRLPEVILNGHVSVPSSDEDVIKRSEVSNVRDRDEKLQEKPKIELISISPTPVPRLHSAKNLRGNEADKIVIDLTCDD